MAFTAGLKRWLLRRAYKWFGLVQANNPHRISYASLSPEEKAGLHEMCEAAGYFVDEYDFGHRLGIGSEINGVQKAVHLPSVPCRPDLVKAFAEINYILQGKFPEWPSQQT